MLRTFEKSSLHTFAPRTGKNGIQRAPGGASLSRRGLRPRYPESRRSGDARLQENLPCPTRSTQARHRPGRAAQAIGTTMPTAASARPGRRQAQAATGKPTGQTGCRRCWPRKENKGRLPRGVRNARTTSEAGVCGRRGRKKALPPQPPARGAAKLPDCAAPAAPTLRGRGMARSTARR
jgi:hypothetical protein